MAEPSFPNTPKIGIAVEVGRIGIEKSGRPTLGRDGGVVDGGCDVFFLHKTFVGVVVIPAHNTGGIVHLITKTLVTLDARIVGGARIANGVARGPVQLFLSGGVVGDETLLLLQGRQNEFRVDIIIETGFVDNIGGGFWSTTGIRSSVSA